MMSVWLVEQLYVDFEEHWELDSIWGTKALAEGRSEKISRDWTSAQASDRIRVVEWDVEGL